MHLLDRAPEAIFAPLVGINARRTWGLLCRLVDRFFGPESVPDYPDGYTLDRVLREVELFLRDHGWQDDSGELLATPLNIQAANTVTRLAETGWLVKEKVGLRHFVSMRPGVLRLFLALREYAEESPQHIGGDVQVIYSQLRAALESPREQAAGFARAARFCSQLINSLSATTLRARDLMRSLKAEETTSVFVQRFFGEHIEELYIRDFKSLRTDNHPLSLRIDILGIVNELMVDESLHNALLAGYVDIQGNRADAHERATLELERDVERFKRLMDVEIFLDRMDRVMEASTQRALALISYRLKANDRIEYLIDDVADTLRRAETLGVPVEGQFLPPAHLVSEARIQAPQAPAAKPVRRTMKKVELTPAQKARMELRRILIANRDMSPAALKRFVEATLKPGQSMSASDLPASAVRDAVGYLGLMRLAAQTHLEPGTIQRNPLLRNLGFTVEPVIDPATRAAARVETPLFESLDFKVTRRGHAA